ncbi:unnamed protein product, partial [Staurois parvus]
MSNDSWQCWGYTDHQGTDHRCPDDQRAVSVTDREERNADNRH